VDRPNTFQDFIRQGFQHSIAGARTDDKVICKIGQLTNVKQKDVFSLFILQHICNRSGQFKCFQKSPHYLKIDHNQTLSIASITRG
jgi:hypothetical protein